MPAPKKAAAVKAEALSTEVAFTFEGETYTVAPTKEWDLDALEAFEDGHIATCVRLILGDAQWATFRKKPRKLADLNALFEAVQRAAGVEGN